MTYIMWNVLAAVLHLTKFYVRVHSTIKSCMKNSCSFSQNPKLRLRPWENFEKDVKFLSVVYGKFLAFTEMSLRTQ